MHAPFSWSHATHAEFVTVAAQQWYRHKLSASHTSFASAYSGKTPGDRTIELAFEVFEMSQTVPLAIVVVVEVVAVVVVLV